MSNIIYQNEFKCNSLLLNDTNIQGGVELSQSVNSGEGLVLGSCCASKAEFSILDLENNITNPQGIEFLYTQCGEKKGYFTVDTAERIKNVGWKITAYDRMMKFEKTVDDFIDELPDSFSLRELFAGLCNFVNVPASATSFTNEELIFYKNFEGSDIKGRDILYWIAEAAGCFAHINSDGETELKFYEQANEIDEAKVITNSDYINYSVLEFTTMPINKLQIRSTKDDIGTIVFEQSEDENIKYNAYIIEGNPLFYVRESEEQSNNSDCQEIIKQAANAIFQKIKNFSYQPFECELFYSEKIPEVGNTVWIKEPDGKIINSIVMNKSQNGMKVNLSATGNSDSNSLTSVNISIKQKNNRTNELKRTLDSTVSKISTLNDNNNFLESSFEQTSDSITAILSRTSTLENSQSELSKKAENIEKTVNSGVSKVVTTSVVINESGITVGNSDCEMETQMTPDSFKVLDKNSIARINVSPIGTKLQKTIIEDDLTVGVVKMIKRNNGVDFVYIGGEQ